MMDRDKKDELPKMQVEFIDAICTPVYEVRVYIHCHVEFWIALTLKSHSAKIKGLKAHWSSLCF